MKFLASVLQLTTAEHSIRTHSDMVKCNLNALAFVIHAHKKKCRTRKYLGNASINDHYLGLSIWKERQKTRDKQRYVRNTCRDEMRFMSNERKCFIQFPNQSVQQYNDFAFIQPERESPQQPENVFTKQILLLNDRQLASIGGGYVFLSFLFFSFPHRSKHGDLYSIRCISFDMGSLSLSLFISQTGNLTFSHIRFPKNRHNMQIQIPINQKQTQNQSEPNRLLQ